VDVYSDGMYVASAIADKDAKPGKAYEKSFHLGGGMRDVTIYLSLYKPVKVLGIGVSKEAKVEKPKPFALARPVVFYGTSITQGGCASRSGMSYQAILGRMLDIDHVNLGFSGNGKGEQPLANAVAEIEASCYVLDFCQNNRTVESVAEVYGPFIDRLRAKRPDTPIVSITPIYSAREAFDPTVEYEKMRVHIREAVSKRIAAGDRRLHLVEGTDLLGRSRDDGLVDGTHPNDLGFLWMAEGLAPRLRKILELR
jgi:lysophospholipase L1-like esterase